ncbi:MAG: chemotaxis protein CheC [Thermoleophilia bacterium]|nr:chemotaxis protein CheC [Thermoleophilia bacterium]
MGTKQYAEIELDALSEVMNTGAGHAAGDLSEMLLRSVSISVPRVLVAPVEEVTEQLGGARQSVLSIGVQVTGELECFLTAIVNDRAAGTLCNLLGVELEGEMGRSALGEIGNLLACAYANALGEMANMQLEIHPPTVVHDELGTIVSSLAAAFELDIDNAVLVDSQLSVQGENCNIGLIMVPRASGIDDLLAGLGL